MPESRIGWAKGVVEREGWFGRVTREAGTRLRCVLGVNSAVPAMLESGVRQKAHKPFCVAVVRHPLFSQHRSAQYRRLPYFQVVGGQALNNALARQDLPESAEEMTLHVCAALQSFPLHYLV